MNEEERKEWESDKAMLEWAEIAIRTPYPLDREVAEGISVLSRIANKYINYANDNDL
jgi:hypothetical protein